MFRQADDTVLVATSPATKNPETRLSGRDHAVP
jgi:hypothetical protein